MGSPRFLHEWFSDPKSFGAFKSLKPYILRIPLCAGHWGFNPRRRKISRRLRHWNCRCPAGWAALGSRTLRNRGQRIIFLGSRVLLFGSLGIIYLGRQRLRMIGLHFSLLAIQCPLEELHVFKYHPDVFIGKPARIFRSVILLGLRSGTSEVLYDTFPALLGQRVRVRMIT